jgi:hypothetical protein
MVEAMQLPLAIMGGGAVLALVLFFFRDHGL